MRTRVFVDRLAQTRAWSFPGWKTMTKSSGGAKTKEQRDVDRRKRQIEKLPSPIAIPDFQAPMEKTVLCDQHFQFPVYQDELDTASLYNLAPPDDFFLYWNAHECARSQLPPVPEVDHRIEDVSSEGWEEHRKLALQYLEKHRICPDIFPFTRLTANVSVVFGSESASFSRRNFWKTAHCGNYMELADLQATPSIHIKGDPNVKYCLVMISPDYPRRVSPNPGFLLHHVVANLSVGCSTGDALLDYIPPLPIEGAGASRVVCALFAQTKGIDARQLTVDFSTRCKFRMETPLCPGLALSDFVDPVPVSVTFLTTTWDIQVQEWHDKAGVLEPSYTPEDLVDILAVNSAPKEAFQISSRTLPDGSVNKTGDIRLEGVNPTQHGRRSMRHLLSSRTKLSRDGKRYVIPE